MPTSRAPFVDVVAAVREHTSQLLGRTIGLSDEDWAAPTALPGWTRSHVAAHLVDGARRLVRVIDGLHSGQSRTMYDSEAEERRTIELGAVAGGLELQIQLDTTASELQELFGSLEGDSSPVDLRPGYRHQGVADPAVPARRGGRARDGSRQPLHHHGPGTGDRGVAAGLPGRAARRIATTARRCAWWRTRATRPSSTATGDFTEVRGPAADLIAWLARGVNSPRLIRTFS